MEEITIRIKRKELEGLLPLVSKAVELRGDRQDLLKIRQKLEERRDKKLSLAQAAMEAGDARTAAATLAGVVAEDLGAGGDDLLKRVQRAAALEVLLAMELIGIPAGTFTMGSPANEKNHFDDEAQVSVTLTQSFELGKYEVTQGLWKSVMGTEPWNGEGNVKADKDCPATFVSWNDATKFCQQLTAIERKSGKLKANEGYRLPTEAEWEYACRAGTTTAFSFGNNKSKLGEYAWFTGNTGSEQYAHKAGLKNPNPWDFHDMYGNVAEWCSDWYGGKLIGGTDPVGPESGSGRVVRGGGWGLIPGDCRSADRLANDPSSRGSNLGFRVVRSRDLLKRVSAISRKPAVVSRNKGEWSRGTMIALVIGTIFIPWIGLVAGILGLTTEEKRTQGGILLGFLFIYYFIVPYIAFITDIAF